MSLKADLQAVRAAQKANAARRAANSSAAAKAKPAPAKPAQKKPSEADLKAAELERQMAELKAQQLAFLEQQRAALAATQREEVVGYLSKAGARVSPALLAQVAPQVDPRTAEGRRALEEFRAQNADIF
ncbi:MAG: hypothetical protein FJ271_34210, partial [Planctomycetes bacterium]|nr:hypothetical protein [Planctomycetota bacterium]